MSQISQRKGDGGSLFSPSSKEAVAFVRYTESYFENEVLFLSNHDTKHLLKANSTFLSFELKESIVLRNFLGSEPETEKKKTPYVRNFLQGFSLVARVIFARAALLA